MPSVVNVKLQVSDVELLNVTLSAGTITPVELWADPLCKLQCNVNKVQLVIHKSTEGKANSP